MSRGRALDIARDLVAEISYAFGANWDVNANWAGDKGDRAEASAMGAPTVVDPTDLDDLATQIEDAAAGAHILVPRNYAATMRVMLGDDWYSVAALTNNEAAIIHSLKEALDRLSKRYGDVSTGGFAVVYEDEEDEERSGYLIWGVSTYVKRIS